MGEAHLHTLTYEVVGLADVVVPHGHLQGLLGEVCVFDVVGELLEDQRFGSGYITQQRHRVKAKGCSDSSQYRRLCVPIPAQRVLGYHV